MRGFVLSCIFIYLNSPNCSFELFGLTPLQATTGTNFHLVHGTNPSNRYLVIKGKAKALI